MKLFPRSNHAYLVLSLDDTTTLLKPRSRRIPEHPDNSGNDALAPVLQMLPLSFHFSPSTLPV